ncbi:DMT family transporter [Streptomyces sp. CSDS2]|uniref:DMT family transporter n=1 Tax=Streptomyces sp. CSDS2 TaxID=3055051 RepID=UPI0025AF07F4|nr:DMT family transporter [Streptomyces sp. CSDS2]MDN3260904.1 DMT family transporter [Streptomyces sp. CSDS2]
MSRKVIYLMLTLSALFWGATFNLVNYTVRHVTPPTGAALRYSIAAVAVLAVLAARRRTALRALRGSWRPLLAMSLIGVVLFNVLFFFGMRHTSPTNGALIQATNPLITALIAGVCYGERISRGHKIGTLVSFAGVAVLILGGSVRRLEPPNIGDLLCVGATTCLALYSILGGRYIKDSTPVVTTGLTTLMGCAGLWAVAWQSEPRPAPGVLAALPAGVWAALAFVGLLATVLAYVFWNYGVSHIGVADTTVFFHLVPVFTVLASLALGQPVTLLQIGAGLVVILGVFVSSREAHAPRVAAGTVTTPSR